MDIEQEIQEKGKTAPRVTPEHIKECISEEHYFTAADGFVGALEGNKWIDAPPPLTTITICVLVLRNGFTVVGTSAPASPENFDAEIGRRIARENAVDQVWKLEGYALKERLNLSAYPERAR